MSNTKTNKSESFIENVKLHEAEKPWKPSFKEQLVTKSHTSSRVEEKIKRNVISTLNKLTPQKFDVLLKQLKMLDIDTPTKLEMMVNLIYQKAIQEPLYCATYAKMCKHLSLVQVPVDNNAHINFHNLFLDKCQNELKCERCSKIMEDKLKVLSEIDPEKRKELEQNIYNEEKKIRDRRLGNIKLIGELFKLDVVLENLIHECIKSYISQGDEESLEYMCLLMKVVGKELDKAESKEIMDSYIAQMQTVMKIPSISSRIRFMLQDVMDLRKNNWVPRRAENTPKTIEEIHREAQLEQFIALELCGS